MPRRAGLLITCMVLAAVSAAPARAQVSGRVTWLSDDRYRGASLSDGDPTVQLALDWDGAHGWYAGTQLTRVRFVYPGARGELEAEPYFGYVRALQSRRSIEAGAQYTWFSHSSRYAYPEFYAALSGERVRTRLAWMPRYFGQATAWYAQVDGNRPLGGPFHAIAHAGVLRQGHGEGYLYAGNRRWRYDVAAGVGVAHAGLELQLTWTTSSGRSDEPCAPWLCGARDAWVVRLSRSW